MHSSGETGKKSKCTLRAYTIPRDARCAMRDGDAFVESFAGLKWDG
ncbi:MAG: hypothetical protein GY820_01095 [Gammaproteobacteria bacterium]|nr:hypothetical protein [Gammaproteobacteria bacterium]